jgi:hypothetical protein
LIDFLERSVPDTAENRRANADALRTRVTSFAELANPAVEPLWEPAVVLAQAFFVGAD